MNLPRTAMKKLRASVKGRGWIATWTNGGHVRWQHDSGAFLFGSATPSDSRAIKNLMAQMKRVEMRV